MSILKHTTTLIVGAILAFAGLQVWQWYHPSPLRTLARPVQPPYDAADARLSRAIDKVVIPSPPEGIVALRPTQKQRDKIQKKVGGELPSGDILAIKDIGRLPDGATAVVTLSPDLEHGGAAAAHVRIYPKKSPFFQWTLERSIGAYWGQGFGDQRLSGRLLSVEFTQSLFRTGPLKWEAKAGTMLTPYGNFEYIMVGAKATF